jgi:hypothetical protein
LAGADTALLQEVRQLIGTLVQIGVRQYVAFMYAGHGIWSALYLLLKQLVKATLTWVVKVGRIPIDKQQFAF